MFAIRDGLQTVCFLSNESAPHNVMIRAIMPVTPVTSEISPARSAAARYFRQGYVLSSVDRAVVKQTVGSSGAGLCPER